MRWYLATPFDGTFSDGGNLLVNMRNMNQLGAYGRGWIPYLCFLPYQPKTEEVDLINSHYILFLFVCPEVVSTMRMDVRTRRSQWRCTHTTRYHPYHRWRIIYVTTKRNGGKKRSITRNITTNEGTRQCLKRKRNKAQRTLAVTVYPQPTLSWNRMRRTCAHLYDTWCSWCFAEETCGR